MNKQQIFWDIATAVMATLFIIIGFVGFSGIPTLDKLSLVWGGLCVGYILTTYLNITDLDKDDE
jgi:hypothetical protein